MIIDPALEIDSPQSLHDRLRAYAFWIGMIGLAVNLLSFVALYMLGSLTNLLLLEAGSYALALSTIAICSYRDFHVRAVLHGGLIAMFCVFWVSAFAYGWRAETLLLLIPFVVYVPLLITMVLPHKVLFLVAPVQCVLMFFYMSTYGLADMGVDWPEAERIVFSLALAFLSSVALLALAVLAIARTQTDQKLITLINAKERIASTDSLTELSNRRAFMATLELNWPPPNPLAIAFVDLDHFKPLNDQYGHAMGDFVLREVAQRLNSVPGIVAAARLGGDEFAICWSYPAGEEVALALAGAIAADVHSRIVADFQTDIGPLSMSASVGYAVYDKSIGSLSMLLRAADAAMRRAKATRSGWATFSHSVDSAALASSSIEFELKSALKSGHIRAAVQPIARVSDLKIVEYELLARWVNSGLEQDPGPAQFIPIAEKQGLLNDILWVTLEEALMALDLQQYRLAVNVSPAQLLASDFLTTLMTILARHNVAPGAITLEITEEVVFRNLERNVAILDSARRAGMEIALDDFGSGYSSLAMLDALPLDKLKIDQGLIKKAEHSTRSANILAAAISLAQQLDLIACVEGVEAREGLDMVTRMGADQVQGYFLAKPQMLQDEHGQPSLLQESGFAQA